MKKILAAIVCSMLLLSATACAASDKQTAVSAESSQTVSETSSVSSAEASAVVSDTKQNENITEESLTVLSLPYSAERNVTVRVYVPAHEEGDTLPVIYMTDGQNLFEDTTVKYGCWYTREAVRAEQKANGQAAIIVGIHNDGSEMERTNDLTPLSMGGLDLPSEETAAPLVKEQLKQFKPAGEAFDDFVIKTVMPAVEKQFPVKKGRQNTAVCGSSSGGLECFYIAMSHPDIFGACGAFSPVFHFYFKNDLEAWVRSKIKDEMPLMYLYVGGGDEQERSLVDNVEWMYQLLEDCYPNKDTRLKKAYDDDMPHNECAWEAYFPEFLHWFLTGQ